jgi:glycosyltransferase involved in cell wall biosynthesis
MGEDSRADWVSIIIPTYNRADILPTALNSVHKQTYRPIELIVVDDGSTDETAEVVKKWNASRQSDDFNLEYVSQVNAGPSAARNRGMVQSTGEYIQFLDSDDRLHPQKLSVHVRALETSPACDVIIGENALFTPCEEEPGFARLDEDRLLEQANHRTVDSLSLLNGNLVNGLYRRALLRRAGPINEVLRWMEDVEYNIRVSTVTTSVRTVEAPLLAFSRHDGDHLTGVRNRPEGFEVGFAAVKAMEDTVDAIEDGREESVRHTIGNFYMGLAHLALRFGQSDNFETAIQSALRNRTEFSFRVKARFLKAFRQLAGNDLTHRLWSRIGQFDTTQQGG